MMFKDTACCINITHIPNIRHRGSFKVVKIWQAIPTLLLLVSIVLHATHLPCSLQKKIKCSSNTNSKELRNKPVIRKWVCMWQNQLDTIRNLLKPINSSFKGNTFPLQYAGDWVANFFKIGFHKQSVHIGCQSVKWKVTNALKYHK